MGEPITLELDGRRLPARLLWNSRNYRVTDQPTVLDSDYWAMTHPLPGFAGWRFQGTDEDGESRVFDVCRAAEDRWQLLRVYD